MYFDRLIMFLLYVIFINVLVYVYYVYRFNVYSKYSEKWYDMMCLKLMKNKKWGTINIKFEIYICYYVLSGLGVDIYF